MSTIPTVGINRDHPIYAGGTNPHVVEGGLPSFGSAPMNSVGQPPSQPQRMGGDEMTPQKAGNPMKSQGKRLSPAGVDSVASERTTRANTPFAGQKGPVERDYSSQGYNTTLPADQDGPSGGPDFGKMAEGLGDRIKQGINAAGDFLSGKTSSTDNRSPAQVQASSDDSAAVANARRDNRKYGGGSQ